jgi:5-methylcytosine-specific restriction endonuclease McrA
LDLPKVKNHTKVYLKAFGYDTNSWIACEVCGGTAVDIHHIESRGMGGSKIADTIENLMALCRPCHVAYGDIKEFKERLKATHNHHLSKRVI